MRVQSLVRFVAGRLSGCFSRFFTRHSIRCRTRRISGSLSSRFVRARAGVPSGWSFASARTAAAPTRPARVPAERRAVQPARVAVAKFRNLLIYRHFLFGLDGGPRAAVAALAALLPALWLAGCAGPPRAAPEILTRPAPRAEGPSAPVAARAPEQGAPLLTARELLIAQPALTGARVAAAQDRNAMIKPEGALPFLRFVAPTAVAASGPDLYVADAGNGVVFRVDAIRQLMVKVNGPRVIAGTRIAAAADRTLYVLSPGQRNVVRYAPDGQLLTRYGEDSTLARPADLAVDAARGRVWVADAVYGQLVEFTGGGNPGRIVAARSASQNAVPQLSALAVGAQRLYATDAGCRCVVEFDSQGTLVARYGEADLAQPTALVADRYGRVWVADSFDASVKVYIGGRLAAKLAANELGVRAIGAMALDADTLYIADPLGARVAMLRVLPPKP